MAVQQIATRLIRTFGSGNTLKKVVTEVIDGKTFTNVFDAKGTLIKQRVKSFSEQMVGDKLVKTKTAVTKDSLSISKTVSDRIYKLVEDAKELIGIRTTDSNNLGSYTLKSVLKKSVTKNRAVETNFYDGIRLGKVYMTDSNRSYIYNDLGLPCPQGNSDNLNILRRSSLKDMRKWHFDNNPTEPYAPDCWNMPSLNDPTNIGHKLNDLDTLL